MNVEKSKNLLVVSVLSIFLIQTINSVYSPAAKPVAKSAKLAPPVAKSIAKPTEQPPKATAPTKTPAAKLTAKPATRPVAAKSALKDDAAGLTINPFVTFDMITPTSKVTFFSKFTSAVAVSNLDTPDTPNRATVDNLAYFLQSLSDCVNNSYSSDGSPKFKDKRYIYGQFSNDGATLQLYTDQPHTEIVGTFSLPTHKAKEYISKLFWYTDAYTAMDRTNDPKVDPNNGNINYFVEFNKDIALGNGKFTIELINPNDNAYKELSQIADFTNLTFEYTDNKSITVEKATTDSLNTIYNGKNNPATINPAITPNDYRARIDTLVKQALANPQQPNLDYAHTDFLSNYYGPKILISFVSQQIKIEAYYNVMWVGLVAADSGLCTISYVKRNKYETYSFNAVNLKKIKSTVLNAPIVKDQLLFYLDAGFDNSNAQVAYISKNDPSNPFANVPCDCYKSKSCNF